MNKREKELTDKEISLYKKEKMLAVDIEVQQKITTNWEKVQAARKENFQNKAKLDTEIAKLEAKKEALAEVLAIKESINIQWLAIKSTHEYTKSMNQATEANLLSNDSSAIITPKTSSCSASARGEFGFAR
jgi:hypothetical protein